jgi:aldehyde dehydrogenase (NAD(P)+)
MVINNASYNCNAAKMLVTSRDWPQHDELLSRLGRALAEAPARAAYYPGALDRYRYLVERANEGRVERFGNPGPGELPWTLISGLDVTRSSPLFRTEPFCPIVSETPLPTGDAAEFLSLATRFANERLWGTLNAMLIAPDSLRKDATLGAALANAMRALRYGTVSLNVWPAVGFGLSVPPWGGFPGATLADVQSGIGWGHNLLMLDGVEQVVLDGSLLQMPEPFWHPGHRHLREMGAALAEVEARPSVLGVARAARWALSR